MGLDFKEAFSSFLHQYFHANANFWNSVKIYGNFKVAVDEYQEDYLFSEVITKSDCCCSSNLLDKVTTPIVIRGSGQPQAPIIIKEEPNEPNRPTIISSDVTVKNSCNITTTNANTTPTLSTSPSTNSSTSTTVVDKATTCGTDGQPSHVETEKTYTVLSSDPTYTIPPRPSRWYISNCQPQATDIDGRPIIPSLLVSSAPTVPSSPNKITDMLQITSCEGDEEAAALQTFSSAQEHEHIPTEDTVTLQGSTFTSEAQVADMKIPVGSVGQFVDRGTTKMEPINSVKHFTDHIDISSVGSVVNGVRFVDQIITKKEPLSDTEAATSDIHLPHSLQDSQKNKHPKSFTSNSFHSNSPQTILSNAQALKSHLSLSDFKPDPHALLVNTNRQPLIRKTSSPSLKVFRKTLNKALRISYQKAMNLNAKNSNFIPTTESPLINDQSEETIPPKPNVHSMDHFRSTNKDITLAKSLDLKSLDLIQPLVAPSIIKLPSLSMQKVDSNLKLTQRSSLKSAMYPSRHKKSLIQFSPCISTESNKKIENLLSSRRALPNAKAVDSIDLTVDNESFVYGKQRNAKYNPKFRCTTCGKYFTRKSSLNEHQKDVHDRTNDKFICCICGKRFTRPQHLRDHMNIHYMCKPHECTSCGHTFFNKISLLRHKRKCYIDKNPG